MKVTLHSIVAIGCAVSPLVAGTAPAKSDYNVASGTLTFQPGVWTQTITITVKSDRKREANETFSVQLSNAVGATIEDGIATVTILNDD
jgi:hydroxyethylthiazole kinase-like sugar kinase family protein